MAILSKGILGPGSGKVGNLVMFSRYGVNILRTVPKRKPKKTPGRLAQRQKMGLVHEFLRPAKIIIHKTFKNEVPTRSPYQAAQSYHLKHAIAGEYPNQYIDMQKALVSHGDIPLPENISFSVSDEGIHLSWDPYFDSPKAANSDSLVFMWRYRQSYMVDHMPVGVRRATGEFLWNKFTTDNISDYTIWIAFRNWRETEYSNSFCLQIAQ
ncbi:DUF6266 family protein [Plebeiibacterium marinum]|uniref:DUF6266 family protein n=1 Tax=Plebeiibacterium marinum TaxID=2992111 RepID=A0AAE3SIT0_9BACT|nr:DUF6266 family protein [Plebeiobacterium marinum]MCW3805010.1 DUF6266 family protein [Plebeiobacterium marinum]